MNKTEGQYVYTDVEYRAERLNRARKILDVGIFLVFIHAFIWLIWGFVTDEMVLFAANLWFAGLAVGIFLSRGRLNYRQLAHAILIVAYFYSLSGVIFFDGMVHDKSSIEDLWFIVVAIAAWFIFGIEENSKDAVYANIYVIACFVTFLLIELPIIEFPPLAPQPVEGEPMAHAVTKIILFSFLLAITQVYMRDIRSAEKFLSVANSRLAELVGNMLPDKISVRLRSEGRTFADGHPAASVLFADLVGFTAMSASMQPMALVNLLDDLFTRFDRLTEKLGLEKIKTIGDAYMVASGLPEPRRDHASAIVELALLMRAEMSEFSDLGIRIGINSGEVVAGIIGRKRLVYDLWGDTVNIASRMESHGRKNEIQISASTYEYVKDKFDCESLGEIELRGRGKIEAYLVIGRKIAH